VGASLAQPQESYKGCADSPRSPATALPGTHSACTRQNLTFCPWHTQEAFLLCGWWLVVQHTASSWCSKARHP